MKNNKGLTRYCKGNFWDMNEIDIIASEIVSSFNADNRLMLKQKTKDMLFQIRKSESMFSLVNNPFLVAKSLYFMLTEDYLSDEEQVSIIKLAYLCLLKNYLKNDGKKPNDAEYVDLVSGSKLAIVLIFMQHQYLEYSIISGLALYINPNRHIHDQLLLFGGIVKEAELTHNDFPIEDVINRYFVDCFKVIYSNLPTGRNLDFLKTKCFPVINQIKNSIEINLNDNLDIY